MAIALLTPYLPPYRQPLFRRLSERHDVEVLCYGRSERYVPAWFADLDHQLAQAPFPARRLNGVREAFAVGRSYQAVIAGYAGGAILPAAYAGARRSRRPFVIWASVWAQPRSPTHLLALPITRRIYRDADSIVAYGEHVRRFVAAIRGDRDIYVAPQAVEQELFGRTVEREEVERFRRRHGLPGGRLVLYVGRMVAEKGVGVLLDCWPLVRGDATLLLIGDGPLAGRARTVARACVRGPLARTELPVAYAACELAVLPSIPTPRFLEPWGLVCNEAMLQSRPIVATTAVGAVAGDLVRDRETGIVVAPGDAGALAGAIDRLLADDALRAQLGAAARRAAAAHTYEAMAEGFDRALARAMESGRR